MLEYGGACADIDYHMYDDDNRVSHEDGRGHSDFSGSMYQDSTCCSAAYYCMRGCHAENGSFSDPFGTLKSSTCLPVTFCNLRDASHSGWILEPLSNRVAKRNKNRDIGNAALPS
jgi:hypothetical protein